MNRLKVLPTLFLVICGITLTSTVEAQKIKYKDLFPLLEAEDYTTGQESLRSFLAANPDHPSANLEMGFMAESFLQDCELAVQHFQKALELIDDKEVKKNEKYYLRYQRRDLRTGKVGVKAPDIQLDLEERIKKCS